MRRIISLVLAVLMLGTGIVFAATVPTAPKLPNYTILGGSGQAGQPSSEVVLVRYGLEGLSAAKLSSGDVVSWDQTSQDGVTILGYGQGTSNAIGAFAGVLVTDALTQDQGGTADITDDRYAYMCVRGYCLAKIDTSDAADGGVLVPSDTLTSSFGTQEGTSVSVGLGTLLQDPGSDALGPVYLW